MAVTYALMDPIMTVARPVAAFFSGVTAGFLENVFSSKRSLGEGPGKPDLSCPVDGCCDGQECPSEEHRGHHSFIEKAAAGFKYAVTDVWADIAGWFFIGLLLSGVISVFIPQDFFAGHLGGGISSMILMLAVGVPVYICATASTPVAAALVMKGVSPGTAMVFLLTGPATNVTSMSVITGILGKRGAALYLSILVVCAVISGLAVDALYVSLGISAFAVMGEASRMVPEWLRFSGGVVLLLISIPSLWKSAGKLWGRLAGSGGDPGECTAASSCGCGCSTTSPDSESIRHSPINQIRKLDEAEKKKGSG